MSTAESRWLELPQALHWRTFCSVLFSSAALPLPPQLSAHYQPTAQLPSAYLLALSWTSRCHLLASSFRGLLLLFVHAAPIAETNERYSFVQEKRYRSMQEHIRRAHPEHYIAKLPATEESFHLMINTPPSERPPIPQSTAANNVSSHQSKPYAPDRNAYYRDGSSNPGTPRHLDDYAGGGMVPAATNAAAALATLHNYKSGGSDWDTEGVSILVAHVSQPSQNRLCANFQS